MAADALLLQHWRRGTASEVAGALRAARDSVAAFGEATAASGSLIQSWVQGREVVEYQHYPPDDIVDRRRGSQFYYHSHRDGAREHGHLHLFWHATASGRRRPLRAGRPAWARTSPSHLLAISLDPRGMPVGLFTVNRWVTEGHWFDAQTTLSLVDRFSLQRDDGHAISARWITAFVRFYRPCIAELLRRRDQCLARRADPVAALSDHRLEVLSSRRIDWPADLDGIEAEATRRGLRQAVRLPPGRNRSVPVTEGPHRPNEAMQRPTP